MGEMLQLWLTGTGSSRGDSEGLLGMVGKAHRKLYWQPWHGQQQVQPALPVSLGDNPCANSLDLPIGVHGRCVLSAPSGKC